MELEKDIINRFKLTAVSSNELTSIEVYLKNLIEKFATSKSTTKQKWEIGWKENLIEVLVTGNPDTALIPKYLTKSKNLRVNGKYYKIQNICDIPLIHHEILSSILKKLPMMTFEKIVELGAGSCNNARLIHTMFPNTPVLLTDWSNESVKIANHLTTLISSKISGARYDFFAQDNNLELLNCLVITIHSLEQIGKDMSVLDRILEKKPKLVINIEPIVEDYDSTSEAGLLLIKLHNQRDYLAGFPKWLSTNSQKGKLKVLHTGKVRIGTEISEPYSFYIWQPTD